MTPSQRYALDRLKAGPLPLSEINGKVRDALAAEGLIRCRAIAGKGTVVVELTGKPWQRRSPRVAASHPAGGWTDERVEQAKKLWAEKATASEIARELGPGFTRNSVIGKLHRLGVTGDRKAVSTPASLKKSAPPPVKRERAGKITAALQPSATKVAPKPIVFVSEDERQHAFLDRPDSISWDDLRGGDCRCRWPLEGDDGSTRYCAQDATSGSYCTHHHAISVSRGTPSERIAHQVSGAAA